MVPINLSKSPVFNLNKPATFDLSKPPDLTLVSKPKANLTNPNLDLYKPPTYDNNDSWDFNLPITFDNPQGLVPISDTGLYMTPEVVAVDDCQNYPGSPACGGTGLSFTPIDLDFSINLHHCFVGVQFNPVLAFVQLPQFNFGWYNPECISNPPSLPSSSVEESIVPIPPNCANGGTAMIVTTSESFSTTTVKFYNGDNLVFTEFTSSRTLTTVLNFEYPYMGTHRAERLTSTGRKFYVKPRAAITFRVEGARKHTTYGIDRTHTHVETRYCYENVSLFGKYITPEWESYVGSVIYFRYINPIYTSRADEPGEVDKLLSNINTTSTHITTGSRTGYPRTTHIHEIETSVITFDIKVYCADGSKPHYEPPPPPPPPPYYDPPDIDPDDMNCCPEIMARLNQLIVKVNKLSLAVGVEDYPATLPASLISKDDGFLGNLIPDPTTQVSSLTQLVGWYIERFDEVIGQWEQSVIIKDTDPTTHGDQPAGVKLPNISETLAELFIMAFQNSINVELLLNICTRNLTESGQIKQQDFKAYGLLQTIADYLNYDYTEVAKELPLSFVPGKQRFDELLKETMVKIAYPQYNDKDDFKKALQRLLEAAAITKALNWRKIDSGGDIKQQFIDGIKAQADVIKKEAEKQGVSLDAFLKEAELGFPATHGIPNPELPYGEPMTERPIIKKLKEEP